MNNQSDSKVGADGRKARCHRLKGTWAGGGAVMNGQWTDGL